MRIIHTSDWHLGHTLHDLPREHEHMAFLEWLKAVLVEKEVDALLVAGDVFDSSNPPAAAQSMWYGFLAQVWKELPNLQVVVVGGNHDSAARLDATRPMLNALGRLHVVGGLRRGPKGRLDLDTHIIPLRGEGGAVEATVAAVPFLRPADLARGMDLVAGIREIYDEVFTHMHDNCSPERAILAMGHAYVAGGRLSELSERKIQSGNQHALPVDLFPTDAAYIALGHLHLAQSVGGAENIRYSGSPIPLSLAEADYPHQVCLVELKGASLQNIQTLAVPRAVEVLRIPKSGSAPLEEILIELETLPLQAEGDDKRYYPYLEVSVRVKQPEPDLRQQLQNGLENRRGRLLRFSQTLESARSAETPESDRLQGLDELLPRDVFLARWARSASIDPSPALLQAFDQLEEWAQHPEDVKREREARSDPNQAQAGGTTE